MLDANVLISYFLAPEKPRTITRVVEACLQPDICLVTPQALLDEVRASVAKSSYLNQRITLQEVEQLVQLLSRISFIPPDLTEAIPEYTPDPDDDYLVAYALLHDVDYMVTGDPHLLALQTVRQTQIILPAEFVEIL